jgi:hypothetical protein
LLGVPSSRGGAAEADGSTQGGSRAMTTSAPDAARAALVRRHGWTYTVLFGVPSSRGGAAEADGSTQGGSSRCGGEAGSGAAEAM